LVIVLT
ncbi:UDP-D-quinovosamine 4-dehydrogenase, partial [Vibrio parahaemolyticus V-223/04]